MTIAPGTLCLLVGKFMRGRVVEIAGPPAADAEGLWYYPITSESLRREYAAIDVSMLSKSLLPITPPAPQDEQQQQLSAR